MKHYKKTIIGSIVTFILGTSCCWLSSLAIWLGGVTFISTVITFIENTQIQFILLSTVLAIISIYLGTRNK